MADQNSAWVPLKKDSITKAFGGTSGAEEAAWQDMVSQGAKPEEKAQYLEYLRSPDGAPIREAVQNRLNK